MLTYIIQLNLYLILFYGFYHILLRNETFYQLNRIVIMGSVLVSFIIPILQSDWVQSLFITEKVEQIIVSTYPSDFLVTNVNTDQGFPFTFSDIIVFFYFLGVFFFSIQLCYKILKLNTLINNPAKKGLEAFSFFNFLYVNENLENRNIIVEHEKTHIQQFHSFDILFLEFVSVINWFNPVIYIYKQSIKNIHEFIADDQSARQFGKTDYALLLFNQAFKTQSDFVNHFFNSSTLKQRIIMLQKSKSKNIKLLKYVILLPLFLFMMVVSAGFVSKYEGKVSPFSSVTDSLKIEGKIFNKRDQKPISGAVVVLKNGYAGTVSDRDGNYTIMVPSNSTLVFSFSGFKTKEVYISSQKLINVEMIEDKYSVSLTNVKPIKEENSTNKQEETHEVFTFVEVMPQFPGGTTEMIKYISKNIKYPESAVKSHIEGKVYVIFIVKQDGSIGEVEILKGIGNGCDEEAARVVKNMPKWIPGKQNGKTVDTKYTLPIQFSLGGNEETLKKGSFADIKPTPLYVVDDKIQDREFVSKLNTDNIEKIDVLKGENAIKAYGEKGSNGVVIITTKKNK